MLELETENGEMKTLIEQMTREVQMLKDQTTNKQKQDAEADEHVERPLVLANEGRRPHLHTAVVAGPVAAAACR